MSSKKVVAISGLFLLIAITVVLVSQVTVNAQECRIIRIHGSAGSGTPAAMIEPETTWISKGTCVVWNNWVRTNEIKVIFEEGKKCQDVTDAPGAFKLDASNCYVTTWIPLGGTASLRFNEEGTYNYTVETGAGVKKRGTIIVR